MGAETDGDVEQIELPPFPTLNCPSPRDLLRLAREFGSHFVPEVDDFADEPVTAALQDATRRGFVVYLAELHELRAFR